MQIQDISKVATSPVYRNVTHLYLDNNRIETLAPLENSAWLKRFTLLSLRGNELQDVSVTFKACSVN